MTFPGPIKIFSGGRFPKCHNNNKVPCQILVKETIHWKRMNIKPTGMEPQCPLQLYSAVFLFAAICQNTALGSHNIFWERNILNILGDDQWDKKSKIDWASVFTQAKWCFLYLSISSWTSYIYGLKVLTLTIQILLRIFIQWIKSGLIVNIGVFSWMSKVFKTA